MVKHTRLIAAVLVVIGIVAVAVWPEPIEVDVTRVTRGPMQVTLDEDGETRVRERFVVSAPAAGRLQRIELEPGDAVLRGKTVVARLTPASSPLIDQRTQRELAASVEAARATVGQAQAEQQRALAALTRAQSSLRRQEALAAAGAIARDDFESAEAQVRNAEEAFRAAQFGVARAEYELQLARARLQPPAAGGRPIQVLAPADGIVLKRLRESESVVPMGEPLLEIGDPSGLEIVADFLSTDAVRISTGDAVVIERWGGGNAMNGRVRRVEPSGFMKVSALGVEEQRVNVVIELNEAAAAARALGDGYRVEVRVIIWREDNALKVPIGSLFRRGNDWAVFVIDNNGARLQTVQLGQRNDVEGQVISGLAEGQTIALHPPDTLTDGARVKIRGS